MPIFVLFLFSLLASAQQNAVPGKLDQVAAGYAKNTDFTGTVLVAQNGKVLLEKGYGLAKGPHGRRRSSHSVDEPVSKRS